MTSDLQPGAPAPDFSVLDDSGKTVSLKDFRGKSVVLYFYPKDDTPGCTAEACAFNEELPDFQKLDAAILGVSKDSVDKHVKFKEKFNLTFPLLCDADGTMCEAYGTWVEKSMYGKKYMGIDRATFLIGPDGRLIEIWRKVKVPGHADAVKATLEKSAKKAA